MSFFKSRKMPINDEDRKWVERAGKYIFELFGLKYLKSKPFIYPDTIVLSEKYKGTEDDADFLVFRIAQIMDISPRSIETEYMPDDGYEKLLNSFSFAPTNHSGAAGTYNKHYENFDTVYNIRLKKSLLQRPLHLLATISHELSHVKLLGEYRMDETDEDLTDLLPVFFGLGIFSANAAILNISEAGISKLGYLTPSIFGYALALWTLYKNEDNKKLLPFLSSTVKDVFKKTVKYIRDNKYSYWNRPHNPGNIKIIKIGNPPKKIGESDDSF